MVRCIAIIAGVARGCLRRIMWTFFMCNSAAGRRYPCPVGNSASGRNTAAAAVAIYCRIFIPLGYLSTQHQLRKSRAQLCGCQRRLAYKPGAERTESVAVVSRYDARSVGRRKMLSSFGSSSGCVWPHDTLI